MTMATSKVDNKGIPIFFVVKWKITCLFLCFFRVHVTLMNRLNPNKSIDGLPLH